MKAAKNFSALVGIVALAVAGILGINVGWSAAQELPNTVTARELTASYWAATADDGWFRPDGSTIFTCVHEDGTFGPEPRVGDRVNVAHRVGWRLSFWNVGALGGASTASATMRNIVEFLTPGNTVVELDIPANRPPEADWCPWDQPLTTEPASDVMDPYHDPAAVYPMEFSGGPSGVFTQPDGATRPANGQSLRAEIIRVDGSGPYIQVSGGFTVRMDFDDVDPFAGFTDETNQPSATEQAIPASQAPEDRIPTSTDFTLDRAIGDVQYSDPAKRASLIDSSARAINSLFHQFQAPYGGIYREWEQPQAGTHMKGYSLIRTDTGMAVLSFKDGTRFVLGRDSQMEVTANGIRLDKGSGYYVFPTSGKRIEIRVPTGRIGVRGTAFSLAVDGQSTTVGLVEGTLEIIPDGASAVTIEAGTLVVMTPTGVTGPNAFDGPAEEATWQTAAAAVPNVLTSVVDRPDPTALALVTGAVVALLVLLAAWIALRRRRRARVAR